MFGTNSFAEEFPFYIAGIIGHYALSRSFIHSSDQFKGRLCIKNLSRSPISFSKFEIGLGRCARNHEFVKNLVLVVNQLHTHLRDNREDHQLDFYMGNYS